MSDSFAAPPTVAHQAPLSMGFPRQEYWSGLLCPPPGDLPKLGSNPSLLSLLHCRWILYPWTIRDEVKVKMKVTQSCASLCDPMDYTVHGILQVRILEWVAYAFSSGSSWPRNQTRVSCIAVSFFFCLCYNLFNFLRGEGGCKCSLKCICIIPVPVPVITLSPLFLSVIFLCLSLIWTV